MNQYYTKSTVYLTQRQKEIFQKFMPYKLSSTIRDILDMILLSDNMIDLTEYNNDPELLGLLYEYRRYLKLSKETYQNREHLRLELYDYLNEKNLPIICARWGHRKAIKICREMIPGFRSLGYTISDRVAEYMILDYIHMVEDTGLDDQAWKEMQINSNPENDEMDENSGYPNGLLTVKGVR